MTITGRSVTSITQIAQWLVLALTFASFILIFFESVPYLRFIVRYLHLDTLKMQILMILGWLLLLFLRGINFSKLLLPAILLCVVGESTAKTTLFIYRELRNVIANPFATYDEKMTSTYSVYKGFYPAMKEIVRLTPTNTTIVIPPQGNPWEIEGNAAMVNYFLYPRRVINMDIDSKNIPFETGKIYVLISKGSSERTGKYEYGWPKIAIPSNNIWKIDTAMKKISHVQDNYNPQMHAWDWGLIEVEHE